ncbi:DUF3631 domain-containing protein [Propionicimonas paludicola]|uniref:DUF3631 domain-containing protein n=1 Tax=Propionicimonas paludicola TaxID=185243 RepID=UPI001472FAB2|nr:DUF3631 domain-containing protein [Propionicimonas paludicola]
MADERLPAYLHKCVDCDGLAQEWSYDHADPDERYAADRANYGAAYSLDTGHYQPRCKSCHVRWDKMYARQRRGESQPVPTGFAPRRFAPEATWEIRAFARRALGLPDDPLSDVREMLGHFVSAQTDEDLDTVALWIAATHLGAHGVGHAIPRLAIVAPSYGAGKSTLLRFVARLSHRGEVIGSTVTNSTITRIAQDEGYSTLCFDEADKTLRPENEGATAILNAGWERGATARLTVPVGQDWRATKVDVFMPVAFAGNGVRLAPDTEERTLTVRLVRSEDTPEVDWVEHLSGVDDRLRARLAAWAMDAASQRLVRKPPAPGLAARDRDRWSIMLSAAHAAGGRWLATAGRLALVDRDRRKAETDASDLPPNEQLMWDVWAIWPSGHNRMSSKALVDALAAHNPSLWGVPSGRPLTAKALSGKLKRFYGITPTRWGSDGERSRGYCLADMARAWKLVGVPDNSEMPGDSGP